MTDIHAAWRTYSLYGFTLCSDFPFADLAALPDESAADLVFTFASEPPVQIDWQAVAPPYVNLDYRYRDGTPFFSLFELPDGVEMMRFNTVADFYLWPTRIVCHLEDPSEVRLAELYLLGTVLAYWAEGRGVATLHASAVAVNSAAVAFVGFSGMGKSSLAASFMHAGYPLLTDDLLAVRYQDGQPVGSAGYPRMRMWPEQVELFRGGVEGFARVYQNETKLTVPVGSERWGGFCAGPQPLATIYLPQRRAPVEHSDAVEILPVAPAEVLFILVSHSFSARLANTLRGQLRRLALLAPLVPHVPVRRLIYPSGYVYLPEVRQAILADMAQMTLLP